MMEAMVLRIPTGEGEGERGEGKGEEEGVGLWEEDRGWAGGGEKRGEKERFSMVTKI